jgi:hypothetical protein
VMGSDSFFFFFWPRNTISLKGDLEKWNDKVFGNVGVQKNRALVELLRLDLNKGVV